MDRREALTVLILAVVVGLYLILPHRSISFKVDSERIPSGRTKELSVGEHNILLAIRNNGLPFKDARVALEIVPLQLHRTNLTIDLDPYTEPFRQYGSACVWDYSNRSWPFLTGRTYNLTTAVDGPCTLLMNGHVAHWWMRRINRVHYSQNVYLRFHQPQDG